MRVLTWIVLLPLMELAVVAILIIGRVGGAATWIWFGGTFLVGFVLSRPPQRAAARPGAWWRRLAGYLLMFPGPLTDLLAVALLVPASRGRLLAALRRELAEAAWISIGRRAGPTAGRAPPASYTPADGPEDRAERVSPRPPRPTSAVRDAEFEILREDDGPPTSRGRSIRS